MRIGVVIPGSGIKQVKLGINGYYLPLGANWVKLGEIGYFAYARHQEHYYYAGDP